VIVSIGYRARVILSGNPTSDAVDAIPSSRQWMPIGGGPHTEQLWAVAVASGDREYGLPDIRTDVPRRHGKRARFKQGSDTRQHGA
jgi:hypothetical protein